MAGLFAKGTRLLKGDGASPENFTAIGNVKSINGPGFKVTVIDTTTHSTVGNYREKAAVLVDAGALTFMVNYDPSDATLAPSTGLINDLSELTESNWQLQFPLSDTSNTQMEFRGFVTGHSFTFPVDNVIDANIEITLDGKPEFTTFTP